MIKDWLKEIDENWPPYMVRMVVFFVAFIIITLVYLLAIFKIWLWVSQYIRYIELISALTFWLIFYNYFCFLLEKKRKR